MEDNIKEQIIQIDRELKEQIDALQGADKNIFRIMALSADAMKRKKELTGEVTTNPNLNIFNQNT